MNAKPAIIANAAIVLLLVGCSPITKEDALSTPGSVIQLTEETRTTHADFAYVDDNLQLINLTDCTEPVSSSHSNNTCKDPDGLYVFNWELYKYAIIGDATITTRDVTYSLDCGVHTDESWNDLYACIPID